MSEPFLGEIRIFGFNFAPRGWAFCQGQLLAISQNTALFSLLGTTYGGNGQTTFALPDLRDRFPNGFGQSHVLGEAAGSETVTLTSNQMPQHTHAAVANGGGATTTHPNNAVLAKVATAAYATAPDGTAMNTGMIGPAGGSQPFSTLPPYLTLNFCIALQGIFPSRN